MRFTVTLLFSLLAHQVFADQDVCEQRHCVAIVDAGSTGSRLHLYAYDFSNPIQIKELDSKKITPGFATIEANQDAIDAYLNRLFAPTSAQHIPVYFYATAGMRILPQAKQKLRYNAVQQWFKNQTQWQLIDAKTITGSEEGIFGWLAVNYALGALTSKQQDLVGVLDMGGASVQITFPVEEEATLDDNNDRVEMDVLGRHFTLFVHSFLGLGQTLLSQQFLDSASCFANGYQLPDGLSAKGDAVSCQKDISNLINKVHAVNRVIKPAANKKTMNTWYALGGVTFLAEDKLFSFQQNQITSQSLLDQSDSEICHKQWQDLNNQYPEHEYLYAYCLYASYYYALMVSGYGLAPNEPINYLPSNQGGDWTLGVVLLQAKNLN